MCQLFIYIQSHAHPRRTLGKNQYVAAVFSALISFFFLFHKYLFTLPTYAYNQMLSKPCNTGIYPFPFPVIISEGRHLCFFKEYNNFFFFFSFLRIPLLCWYYWELLTLLITAHFRPICWSVNTTTESLLHLIFSSILIFNSNSYT